LQLRAQEDIDKRRKALQALQVLFNLDSDQLGVNNNA
jgi:hypothetical protein